MRGGHPPKNSVSIQFRAGIPINPIKQPDQHNKIRKLYGKTALK
jgi:hypothetical protein